MAFVPPTPHPPRGVSTFGLLSYFLFVRLRRCAFSRGASGGCLISDVGGSGIALGDFLLQFCVVFDVMSGSSYCWKISGRGGPPPTTTTRASPMLRSRRRFSSRAARAHLGDRVLVFGNNRYGIAVLLALDSGYGAVKFPRWPGPPSSFGGFGGRVCAFPFFAMAYSCSTFILGRAMRYFPPFFRRRSLAPLLSPFCHLFIPVPPSQSQGAQKGYHCYRTMRRVESVTVAGIFGSVSPIQVLQDGCFR